MGNRIVDEKGRWRYYCFATTRMVPRNWTHDEGALHAWFICNLDSRISFLFTQCTINQYPHSVQAIINQPLAEIIRNPNLLGGPVSCSWWWIPIHSGPLPGSKCPTLWLLSLSPLSQPLTHITLFVWGILWILITRSWVYTTHLGWDHNYDHEQL
jgi:hypothetical protein